jgi:prepilin-type N-terminal cleavage/methylation domain-containing protein
MKTRKKNNEGFTLIEVIAVLVILGILAAVAIPKYIDLTENAERIALNAGISELNGREAMAWGDAKLTPLGVIDDGDIFDLVTTNPGLGTDYTLDATVDGGTLKFGGSDAIDVDRDISTSTSPGIWTKE